MAYPIKNTTSVQTNSLLKLNLAIGVNQGGYGLTSSTAFWNGKTPNVSGYVTYIGNGTSSPTMYISTGDTQLITLSNQLGGSGITTIGDAVNYLNFVGGNYICVNMDCPNIVTSGLTTYLDAGYTPSYSKTGTTWRDLSGNGVTGTLVNGPTFDSSNYGSIVFDGVDDSITLPANTFTSGSPQNGTFIIKLKMPTFDNTVGLVFFRDGGSASNLIYFYRNAGGSVNTYAWLIYSNSGSTLLYNTYLPNQWYEIAFTFDSQGNVKGYTNGVQSNSAIWDPGSTSWNRSGTITPRLQIASPSGTGNVQRFMSYNRALSASEILQNYYAGMKRFIPTNGLLMWLDGENTNTRVITPTTAIDVSNNNYNGTLINGTSLSHRDAGTSFYFDGTNDYINCGNIMPLSDYTKVVIFKVPNFSYSDNLMSGNGQYLYLAGTPYLRTGHYVSGGEAISSYQTLVNTWNFAVVTFSTTSGFNIYQNGNTSVGSNSSTVVASATDLTLGSVNGSFLLQGQIGISMLYSRVLTSAEILDIYTAYKGRFGYA